MLEVRKSFRNSSHFCYITWGRTQKIEVTNSSRIFLISCYIILGQNADGRGKKSFGIFSDFLLKYSLAKSARKCYFTSLFTLLRTQFLSDFLIVVRGSNLGRSYNVEFTLPCHIVFQFTAAFSMNRTAIFASFFTKILFCMHFCEIFRPFPCSNGDVFIYLLEIITGISG